jgi:hypothetical protein
MSHLLQNSISVNVLVSSKMLAIFKINDQNFDSLSYFATADCLKKIERIV